MQILKRISAKRSIKGLLQWSQLFIYSALMFQYPSDERFTQKFCTEIQSHTFTYCISFNNIAITVQISRTYICRDHWNFFYYEALILCTAMQDALRFRYVCSYMNVTFCLCVCEYF